MKPIPKTIPFKCPKDIYDEIKKCGYFPTTELIQPEDKVEFVSVSNIYCNDCGMYYKNGDYTFCGDCNNTMKQLTFGTHKATPYALSDDIEVRKEPISYEEYYYYFVRKGGTKMYELSEKLCNGIKENFKGYFIMNRLENDETNRNSN